MFKPTKNPQVAEITKNSKKRNSPLGNLSLMDRLDGTKGCVWCGDPLKSKHPNTRYCKDPLCFQSAWAWFNPQGPDARHILLDRQNYRCNICQFDYSPWKDKFKFRHVPYGIPPGRAPEVDHVIAIVNGGTGLGLENHQAICYTCHKAKTKSDVAKMTRKKRDPNAVKCSVDKCRALAKSECECGLKMCHKHRDQHFLKVLQEKDYRQPYLNKDGKHYIVDLKTK